MHLTRQLAAAESRYSACRAGGGPALASDPPEVQKRAPPPNGSSTSAEKFTSVLPFNRGVTCFHAQDGGLRRASPCPIGRPHVLTALLRAVSCPFVDCCACCACRGSTARHHVALAGSPRWDLPAHPPALTCSAVSSAEGCSSRVRRGAGVCRCWQCRGEGAAADPEGAPHEPPLCGQGPSGPLPHLQRGLQVRPTVALRTRLPASGAARTLGPVAPRVAAR